MLLTTPEFNADYIYKLKNIIDSFIIDLKRGCVYAVTDYTKRYNKGSM